MFTIPAIDMAKTGQNIVILRKKAGLTVKDFRGEEDQTEGCHFANLLCGEVYAGGDAEGTADLWDAATV